MKMNKHTIEWAKIYPNIQDCSIQTFNEQDKEDKTHSRILPMTRANLEWCEKLQETEPYGIYFSVNPMESWKRNKESVKKIQTWICDIDDWTKEEQLELIKNAPLPPSLVVESVHGFHLYYLAEKELTEEEFVNGNLGLRNYYHWDIKVCRDTARVLRIPWFYHQKWEKVLVEYREDLGTKMYYPVSFMNEAFPNQTETTPQMEKQRKELNLNLNEWDSFRTKAWELDSKMMLEEFSWTGWVNGDMITFKRNSNWTEQIYVNWKSTWCWIDRNWLIGSGDKWWPTRIQWLKWYWMVDRKRLAEDLKKSHPELDEKKKVVKLNIDKMMEQPTKAPELRIPDFTWGDQKLDDLVWKLSRGQLVILTWETWAWKTTFATFIARQNENSCYFVLEDSRDNIARRYALKRAGITKAELNNWNRWDYKQALYEEAYLRFINSGVRFVDVWHKIDIWTLIDTMRDLKEKWFGMFFIDNLGYVIGDWISEAEQTADISSKLVSFCLEEDVCVVLLHHFKKPADGIRRRDISQMRWSWKLGDDAFFVANYNRQDEWTILEIFKDRNRWELENYLLQYDRGDFVCRGVYNP